jgi:hypothetical protein
MDNEILFSERQRFKQWWVWMILIGINALFLFGVYKQVINGQQFGDKPMSDTGLLLTTGLTVLITMLFASFRLDTIIKRDGIYVRFFSISFKFQKVCLEYNFKIIRQTICCNLRIRRLGHPI